MEDARALAIVSALANGVDPLTGEVFAVDSPYQSPDVIRALYSAARALETNGRRRTRGPRVRRAMPANRGARTRTDSCYRPSTKVGRSPSWRRRTAARAAAFRQGSSATGG
jgi:hypothetical protein